MQVVTKLFPLNSFESLSSKSKFIRTFNVFCENDSCKWSVSVAVFIRGVGHVLQTTLWIYTITISASGNSGAGFIFVMRHVRFIQNRTVIYG